MRSYNTPVYVLNHLSLVVNSQRIFLSKKLVKNACIKAFWNTKDICIQESINTNISYFFDYTITFVLKISGIQK